MHKDAAATAVARLPQGLRGVGPAPVVHARRAGALRHAVGAVAAGAGARGGARGGPVRPQASRAGADARGRSRSIATSRAALGALAAAADAARGVHRAPGLTLSTTVSFASLWVIPRLPAFRARHPDVEVYVSADDRLIDLGRGDVDVAVRYLADAQGARGGRPALRRADAAGREPEAACAARRRRSPSPPTSRGTCCCTSTTPTGARPGSNGACGLRRTGSRE